MGCVAVLLSFRSFIGYKARIAVVVTTAYYFCNLCKDGDYREVAGSVFNGAWLTLNLRFLVWEAEWLSWMGGGLDSY